MRGTIKIMNNSGHTSVKYDTEKDVVEEAEAILLQESRRASVLFDGVTKEQIGQRIPGTTEGRRTIMEEHEEVLVVPPLAGG